MISWESPEQRAAFLSWSNGCHYDTGVDHDPLFEDANEAELAELHAATRGLFVQRNSNRRLHVFCPQARQAFNGTTTPDLLVTTFAPNQEQLAFTMLHKISSDNLPMRLEVVARYETVTFDSHGVQNPEGLAHTTMQSDELYEDDAHFIMRGLYLGMRFAVQTELGHDCPPTPRHLED